MKKNVRESAAAFPAARSSHRRRPHLRIRSTAAKLAHKQLFARIASNSLKSISKATNDQLMPKR